MPTPSLASVAEGNEDTIDFKQGPNYVHEVKIEFVLKSPSEKVYAKAIMVKTMKVLFANVNAGEYVTLYDTDNKEVNSDLRGIPQESLAERFCIEIGGSDKSIVFFGFIIKTNLSFQAIKKRTIQEFLKTNTYMRLHRGGFVHGVNWSTLGFILEEHPLFTNLSALRSSLMNNLEIAWSNDSEIFDQQKKDDIAAAIHPGNKGITFNPFNIPIEINTSTVSARNEVGASLKVNAVVVTIPQKFYYIGNFLMDHLMLVRKTATMYIPTGFKKEDPNGHYELIEQHRDWLDQHRNIPILNVPTLVKYENEMNTKQKSLQMLLREIQGVERCNYDYLTKRVNVSVNATTIPQVSKAISEMLKSSDLSFKPTIKQNYNPTGSLGSKQSGTSKYLDTVSKYKKTRSPSSSVATSIGNQSHVSNRSQKTYTSGRTWNNIYRIPTEIDFTEDNFPAMPPQSESPITTASERNANPQPMTYREAMANGPNTKIRTTVFHPSGYEIQSPFTPVVPLRESPYPNDTTDSLTIQSAISQALATAQEAHLNHLHQQQDAHKKEIENLTLAFQAQFKSFQETITKSKQPPERIQALEEKLDRTSNNMDERLDKIINLLLLTQTNAQQGPSPYRKKSRSAYHDEEGDDTEMEVEHFNMTHYHQTVQTVETVETVEIIETDHTDEVNTDNQDPVMDDLPHQESTHPMIARTQQDPEHQNMDTDWLRRTTDT